MKPKVKIEIKIFEDTIIQELDGNSNDILYCLLYTVNSVMRDGNISQMNRIKDVIDIFSNIIENEDKEEVISKSGEIIK